MSGKEIPNHIQSRASMVVNGTAPEECSPHMKQLRKNPIQNTTLGKKTAVCKKVRVSNKDYYLARDAECMVNTRIYVYTQVGLECACLQCWQPSSSYYP